MTLPAHRNSLRGLLTSCLLLARPTFLDRIVSAISSHRWSSPSTIMTDGFDKDLLMLGGTLAGVYRRGPLDSRKVAQSPRSACSREDQAIIPGGRALFLAPLTSRPFFSHDRTTTLLSASLRNGSHRRRGNSVELRRAHLSRHLQSILFLDMTGTALAAFLLGPWWGAIVALLSNSLVNWLLYPEVGADVVIFPWSLVNMTGGLFWGIMARQSGFRHYLRAGRNSIFSHAWFLFTFGILGAVVMSIPGTLVQAALGEQAVFARILTSLSHFAISSPNGKIR